MATVSEVLHDVYSRRRIITIAVAALATLAVPLLLPSVPQGQRGIVLAAGVVIGLVTVMSMPSARLN